MILRLEAFYLITLGLTIILGMLQAAARINMQMIVFPQLAPGLAALLILLLFPKHRIKLPITSFYHNEYPSFESK